VIDGIEVTTGFLGQGVANAVGLAIASKHLGACFNRPGLPIVDNHTFCMVGDACLQEGVGLEAISLAGHLRLDNLTIIYDDNQVTCDGSVDLTNTEDVNAKMSACGWEVVNVQEGCFNVDGLVKALQYARSGASGKPTFLNVRTIIGVGSAVAGNALAHGGALGVKDVADMKRMYGFEPSEHFLIHDDTRAFFENIPARGESLVADWNMRVAEYKRQYPELAAEFQSRVDGKLPSDWQQLIPQSFSTTSTPSRKSSSLVFGPIASEIKSFIVGTADLSPSVHMMWTGKRDFQHVSANALSVVNTYTKVFQFSLRSKQHAVLTVTMKDDIFIMV